ncbi:MAG: 3-hydroxyacyl-CoA dehydrogenase NAD-binding domain-containing protein [Crocinitomicaceae bacterium]|nr:3-hydroxyacyl-CoA dehydrogenase NAD-binding domain-containing protein [Crocinitomicaceae bacterium]
MRNNKKTIAVIGAGTMGSGIAQVAAQNNHSVVLVDTNKKNLESSKSKLQKILNRIVEKGKITQQKAIDIIDNINYTDNINSIASADLVIEAIIEDLKIKNELFIKIEELVSDKCIIASNTSSLSIASLGACLKDPERIIGLHFFNPAPLMPLVEIIPAVQTNKSVVDSCKELMNNWGKTGVLCKDTPGFIVNRVARPFYGEALRIYEEGIADFATIDWAMTEIGGFKMGPFTLMDYIGNDVNYAVTCSVFEAFYYDPRFKPSFTQKRYSEAGYLGRKSGRGYFDYEKENLNLAPTKDVELGKAIVERILAMLINEAIDAVFMQVANVEDVDLAMTKGVNYPKGLLKWGDEIGLENVLEILNKLYEDYSEDRYRPNPLLKRMVKSSLNFYS